jgi:hypothetical protein
MTLSDAIENKSPDASPKKTSQRPELPDQTSATKHPQFGLFAD